MGLPPTPHPQGRGTLAGEKGVGRVPIPTRGIHCGTLYMYVLCATYPREIDSRKRFQGSLNLYKYGLSIEKNAKLRPNPKSLLGDKVDSGIGLRAC